MGPAVARERAGRGPVIAQQALRVIVGEDQAEMGVLQANQAEVQKQRQDDRDRRQEPLREHPERQVLSAGVEARQPLGLIGLHGVRVRTDVGFRQEGQALQVVDATDALWVKAQSTEQVSVVGDVAVGVHQQFFQPLHAKRLQPLQRSKAAAYAFVHQHAEHGAQNQQREEHITHQLAGNALLPWLQFSKPEGAHP